MASCIRPRLFMRLVPIARLLLSLVLSFGTVLAAAPTVTANPALVPFSAVPGQPGVTTLTFTAGGTTGLTACGQDNTILPTFPLGAVDANTPLVVNFPFIQAGKYTFWVSSDASCDAAKKLQANGAPVQATASRLGPTGVAAQDAVYSARRADKFSSPWFERQHQQRPHPPRTRRSSGAPSPTRP